MKVLPPRTRSSALRGSIRSAKGTCLLATMLRITATANKAKMTVRSPALQSDGEEVSTVSKDEG